MYLSAPSGAYQGYLAPQRQAIQLCEWALRSARGDAVEAGKALRAWARRNGVGAYNPALLAAPPATFGGHEQGGV